MSALGLAAANKRLHKAAQVIADVHDANERDPNWDEAEELENAAIAYGRAARVAQPADNTKAREEREERAGRRKR